MGFIDAFKRWRLAQKGMSSGKKRRQKSERAVAGTLDRNSGVRLGLYIGFIIVSCLFVFYNLVQGNAPFAQSKPTILSLHALMCVGIIFFFELQHGFRPRNGRTLLIFYSLTAQVALNHMIYLLAGRQDVAVIAMAYAFAPMVCSVLLGRVAGMFVTIAASMLGIFMVPEIYGLHYIVMSTLAGLMVVIMTRNVRRRVSLLRAGLYTGIVVLVIAIIFQIIEIPEAGNPWRELSLRCLCAVGVSVAISMFVSGILPVLESVFFITTDISWLELSDLNHKLLRRLQLEAPGTFQHSMVVASLSEAAAESIGANATQCRVCSYFHDIGKLTKPEYFIENQGHINPHDSLTPTMSALVIIAHVKDGVDLAVKNKLNPHIVDVIREHHGDSLVYYFYRKAQEQQKIEEEKVSQGLENSEDLPEINEKNFRYPGPIPSSKESGIISLADAIESASRSLQKPTPQRIRTLIDDIVRSRVNDGQLDDSGLTFNELKTLRASFAKSLRSMLHTRIAYPKEEKKKSLTEQLRPRSSKDETPTANAN